MTAMLTFYPRRAMLEAKTTARVFSVPTYHDPSRIVAWEETGQLRAGKVLLWDHAFELPGGEPGRDTRVVRRIALGPELTGMRASLHPQAGAAAYVGTLRSGIHIHGFPVCNGRSCIVVLRQWDDLLRALAAEPRLSFSISV